MPNFADPDFEPTDEDLRALSREAFADVGARHREALERLRGEIAALRATATTAARRPPPSSGT